MIDLTQLLVGLGIAYVLALAYNNGRQAGNQHGWSKAWHRARQRFQRRGRHGDHSAR